MAESKHTPGEWYAIGHPDSHNAYIGVKSRPLTMIASEMKFEDAVLGAASPDMLKVLEVLEFNQARGTDNRYCPGCGNREPDHHPDCILAAVIAKAKGSTEQFQPGQCHECKKVQNGVMEIADGRKLCRDCFLALKTREAADAEAKGETDG